VSKTFKTVGFECEGYVVYTFLQDEPPVYVSSLITPDGVIAAQKAFPTRVDAMLFHELKVRDVKETIQQAKPEEPSHENL
jgi:hypothetical protein